MSSDWSTVNAQSTSATSHHSTPTKPRLVSHRFTHQSVDEGLKKELNRYRHSSISFEDFLKSAFEVSTKEMEDLKKTVTKTSVHTTDAYKREQDLFAKFSKDLEIGMYKPFANMSNMVLGRHQSGERIKVLDFDGKTYVTSNFASRKPDVVLVPKKDGDTDLSMTTVKWHHMLCVLEFKKKQKQKETATTSTTIGKRTREGQGMETVGGDRKRPSSSSKKSGMSGSRVSTHTAANSPSTPLQVPMESERRQGPTAEDWSVVSNEDVEGHTSVSSSIGGHSLRRSKRGKSKGKGTSSNHGNSNVPLDGIDTPETSTAREPMGPPDVVMQGALHPDVVMQGALHPETVQSEGYASETSEDYSVLRRTSAVTSNPTQATGISSNATAQSQTGRGTANEVEVQLANYITEVMSDRSGRTFAFGATIAHTKMRLTYYSRSTYAISDEIDILEQPELFALFLVLFSKQSLEKLGFNTDIKFCDPFDTKREESKPLTVKMEAIEGGDNFELKPEADLKLGKCIHTEYCLLGRATAVYELERPEGCDIDLVLKLSWQKKGKRREDKAILVARDVDAVHSPEIYGVAVLNEKSPSASFKAACRTAPKKSEERELRILLMRKYYNVEDLEDAEFTAIMPQFVIYVHKLFSEKELLHRDISIFNMAYYEKDNEKIAVLIDFDLATFPEDSESSTEVPAEPLATATQDNLQGAVAVPNAVQPVQERSGTTPFMAIETLDSDSPGYKHHLCHELESIFYVIIWHAVGYRHKKGIYPTKDNRNNTDRRKVDILKGWRAGSWDAVKKEKNAFISEPKEVLGLITYPILVEIVIALLRIIGSRQQTIVSKSLEQMRLIARAKIQQELQSGTLAVVRLRKPIPVAPSPKIDIFPEFAEEWGITGVECQRSCCAV